MVQVQAIALLLVSVCIFVAWGEKSDPQLEDVGFGAAFKRQLLLPPATSGPFIVQSRQDYDKYGHHALGPGRFTFCKSDDPDSPVEDRITMSRIYFQAVRRKVEGTQRYFNASSPPEFNAVLLVRYMGYASTGHNLSNMTLEMTAYQDKVWRDNVFVFQACSHAWPATDCVYEPGVIGFGVSLPFREWDISSPFILHFRIYDEYYRQMSCTMSSIAEIRDLRPGLLALWYLMFLLLTCIFIFEFYARISTAETTLRRTLQRRNIHETIWKVRPGSAMLLGFSGHQLLRFPVLAQFCLPGFAYFLHQMQFFAAMVMIPIHSPEALLLQSQWTTWPMLMGFSGAPSSILGHYTKPTAANTSLPEAPFDKAFRNEVASPLGMFNVPNTIVNYNESLYGLAAYAHDTGLSAADLVWCCLVTSMVIIGWILLASAITYGVSVLVRPSTEAAKKIASALPTDVPHSTHLAMLQGSLLRFVHLFHLPLTISVWYGLVGVSPSYRTFFCVIFLLIVVLVPIYVLWKIWNAPARLLYQDKLFFLRYGPVYNIYRPGAHRFAATVFGHSFLLGTIIGTSQNYDKVGAILAMIIELAYGTIATLYLPWVASGMGPINLFVSALRFCMAISVLLGSSVTDLTWLSRIRIGYVTVVMQVIFGAVLLGVFLTNLSELVLRLYSGALFDKSTPERDCGLLGAARGAWRKLRGRPPKPTPPLGWYAASMARTSMSSFNSTDMWRVPITKEPCRWEGIAILRRTVNSLLEKRAINAHEMREAFVSQTSLTTEFTHESMYWIDLLAAPECVAENETREISPKPVERSGSGDIECARPSASGSQGNDSRGTMPQI